MRTFQSVLVHEVNALRDLLPLTMRYRGNLGALKFKTRHSQSMATIIGASYTIFDDVLDLVRDNFTNAWVVTTAETRERIGTKASEHYRIYANRVQQVEGESAIVFPAFCAPLVKNRNNDSEFLLLNFLEEYQRLAKVVVTEIEMVTEQAPCKSCLYVIQQFLARNQQARLSMFYLLTPRMPAAPLSQHRLSIEQLATDMPPVRLRKIVLEVAEACAQRIS